MKPTTVASMSFLALLLSACVGLQYSSKIIGNGYKIVHVKNNNPDAAYSVVDLEYRDYSFMRNAEEVDLQNRMASEEMKKQRLSRIPKGGMLFFTLNNITIETANPNNYEFLIKRGDTVLYRQRGPDRIPDVPPDRSSLWWSMHVISLPEPILDPITVYVVSTVPSGRDEFTISRP